MDVEFRLVKASDPVKIWDEIQDDLHRAYFEMYGDPGEAGEQDFSLFVPPHGELWVVYANGQLAATGAWVWIRQQGYDPEFIPSSFPPETVELKRLFVRDEWLRLGMAAFIDGVRQRSAADAGAKLAVLETGAPQKGSIALRMATGYVHVEPFGYQAKAQNPESNYFGKWL